MADVQAIVDEMVGRAKDQAEKALSRESGRIYDDMVRQLEDLRAASRIVLPVNVLDIIAKGGLVLSKEYELKTNYIVEELRVEAWCWSQQDFHIEGKVRGRAGRYRMTVIVEALPDQAEAPKEA